MAIFLEKGGYSEDQYGFLKTINCMRYCDQHRKKLTNSGIVPWISFFRLEGYFLVFCSMWLPVYTKILSSKKWRNTFYLSITNLEWRVRWNLKKSYYIWVIKRKWETSNKALLAISQAWLRIIGSVMWAKRLFFNEFHEEIHRNNNSMDWPAIPSLLKIPFYS